MKKKLLSLVLAGAMVASTSVSAFADTNEATHKIQNNSEKQVEVKVEGNIASHNGTVLPPSTVTVTVPTSANFTVKNDGSLTSATMRITNGSDTQVSVIASRFIDTSGTEGINIVKDEELNERKKIKLKLTGGNEDIVLTSEKNTDFSGKMYKNNGADEIREGDGFVIGNVTKDIPLELTLTGEGKATSASDTTAIQDDFKLILKIKRER